ncbi:adenine-specific methyltransferase EcoRI family protein [Negativicoccus succinicivorans]|uniref:adenine-specific methyltransferase EcoRI family protein n=1 Tax=Negativicoccus succinicivorans TaxID=620903 RepID=UPI00291571BF|nr:adenine-specific methyltransferase EcoRI family protein [Negativicoccus succinicivorans]MDU5530060.1 adenine-specific methyltransferase EcoRI family protein [Negativicoccus succinicivorans]MDU5631904.1 adenine-specific methyltransferase EcoRI family protein [Enterococcus faecalis]
MAGNENLARAAREKNDEFYTRLTDIEKELRHYKEHFKGKTVFCNCDDPFESNFFKYFVLNFNQLGLKKLIATCYATSPISNKKLSLFDVIGGDEANKNKPYKAVVTKIYDTTGDGGVDMLDVAELFKMGENTLTELEGDGDFRSEECLELLKEADIVVTNPPFSLFREYVSILGSYDKKFVIMGNKNAITYKEFFPLLKENKVWVGATSLNGGRWMIMPNNIEIKSKKTKIDTNGDIILNVAGVCWYTNLDINKRHEDLILIRKYNPEDFPTYDNYNAINVDKVTEIPYDYDGVIGVPITFIDKYNPDQFEIIGLGCGWNGDSDLVVKKYSKNQKQVDKNSTKIVSKLNDGTPLIKSSQQPKKTYYLVDDEGFYYRTYGRVLIRNKRPELREED